MEKQSGFQFRLPAPYLIPVLSAKVPPSPSFSVPTPHRTSSYVCPQWFTCSGQEAGEPNEERNCKSGQGTTLREDSLELGEGRRNP